MKTNFFTKCIALAAVITFADSLASPAAHARLAPGNCPQAVSGAEVIEAMKKSGYLEDLCIKFNKDALISEGSKNGYSNPSPCSAPQLQIAKRADSLCTKWEEAKKNKK